MADTQAQQLLRQLAEALNTAFISSWQSTHQWQKQLDAANEFLARADEGKDTP